MSDKVFLRTGNELIGLSGDLRQGSFSGEHFIYPRLMSCSTESLFFEQGRVNTIN
jgi:hypothetical protein